MTGYDWNIASREGELIPVAKPRLPRLDRIAPYIERIDQSRYYSNRGALSCELEARLAAHAGGAATAVLVSNATLGLTLALQSAGAAPGAYCATPAWTFAATAHAIVLAGLKPWLVDVDPDSWALEPQILRRALGHAPGPVTAVVPVAPFGSPIDPAPWDAFEGETGIKVVLDAAAGFDRARVSSCPTVVSLHATKSLGVGEGGYVLSSRPDLVGQVARRANFGFQGSREASMPGMNAKLSEHTAALGLAALDEWPETRAELERVATTYARLLAGSGAELQRGLGPGFVATTAMVRLPQGRLRAVEQALTSDGVGSRRWWGGGLHRHAAFAGFPRTPTPQTDALAESVLGLPCWVDLADDEIARICSRVLGVI